MTPTQIKKMRSKFQLGQEQMAIALGIGTKTYGQYEIGFRKPGGSALLLMSLIDSLPLKEALSLIDDLTALAVKIEKKKKVKT